MFLAVLRLSQDSGVPGIISELTARRPHRLGCDAFPVFQEGRSRDRGHGAWPRASEAVAKTKSEKCLVSGDCLLCLCLVQQHGEPARDGQAALLHGQADGGGRDDGPGGGREHGQYAEDECHRSLSDRQGGAKSFYVCE